jgi:hypothetical protein
MTTTFPGCWPTCLTDFWTHGPSTSRLDLLVLGCCTVAAAAAERPRQRPEVIPDCSRRHRAEDGRKSGESQVEPRASPSAAELAATVVIEPARRRCACHRQKLQLASGEQGQVPHSARHGDLKGWCCMRWIALECVAFFAVVGALVGPAACQTPAEQSPDLVVLAEQMPECKEFRNDCQVCVRLAGGTLGCSNIGIACGPSGHWRCSMPGKPNDQSK